MTAWTNLRLAKTQKHADFSHSTQTPGSHGRMAWARVGRCGGWRRRCVTLHTARFDLAVRIRGPTVAKPRYGYRRITGLLRESSWRAGLARVFRLWQREGLKEPEKKGKKRRLGSSINGCHRRRAEAPNHVWCWGFVFDRTVSRSQLKWLSVVDKSTRECLALWVDRGITSEDVIDTLSELFAIRGVPP